MDKREARETHESSVRNGSKNNPPTLTFSSLELHYPPSDKNSLEDVQIKIVYATGNLLKQTYAVLKRTFNSVRVRLV